MYQQKKVPIGTRCMTGQVCPESGVWKAVAELPFGQSELALAISPSMDPRRAPIAIGNRFPPYRGVAVTWVLTAYA
ncbi:MAG: hypothetical protein B7Y08_04500 [Rhodospirillales bacterium 24-66-33]|jgi:hypothetical protein|nr:MAG: hypothetical protein B7Y57_04140 [Rhodospirillales bacterium 35-66-84]OYZ96430.1 MAG: hypothetical protein B7Y08_04500 [Rhodospirillales bacterium 24-66-33]OZB28407.1 MAG: hypothetical protein B7X63_00645 [Rhodospirillales bacterium 39-66-50]